MLTLVRLNPRDILDLQPGTVCQFLLGQAPKPAYPCEPVTETIHTHLLFCTSIPDKNIMRKDVFFALHYHPKGLYSSHNKGGWEAPEELPNRLYHPNAREGV